MDRGQVARQVDMQEFEFAAVFPGRRTYIPSPETASQPEPAPHNPLNGVTSRRGHREDGQIPSLPPTMAPSWADVAGKGVRQPHPTLGSPSFNPLASILAVYRACAAEGLWVRVQLESLL